MPPRRRPQFKTGEELPQFLAETTLLCDSAHCPNKRVISEGNTAFGSRHRKFCSRTCLGDWRYAHGHGRARSEISGEGGSEQKALADRRQRHADAAVRLPSAASCGAPAAFAVHGQFTGFARLVEIMDRAAGDRAGDKPFSRDRRLPKRAFSKIRFEIRAGRQPRLRGGQARPGRPRQGLAAGRRR